MDITPKNTNRVLILAAISLVISLSFLFQEQLNVASTYISHWTYQIAPTCRRCDDKTVTLDNIIEINFGLPPGWTSSPDIGGKTILLTSNESFATLTGIYIISMDSEQIEFYKSKGLSEYASDWLNDTVRPQVGNVRTVFKFGRTWEHVAAEAGIRFGISESSFPNEFEIYVSEAENNIIQLVTSKSAFQATFNLKERDQLDMIINSLTFE